MTETYTITLYVYNNRYTDNFDWDFKNLTSAKKGARASSRRKKYKINKSHYKLDIDCDGWPVSRYDSCFGKWSDKK